ncbi:MAG: hypothetical protein Tsb005_13300 [Gammaproteobacteria bacterium]
MSLNTSDIDFEDIFARTPGNVFLRGRHGEFLGCNNETAKNFGLKSRHEIIGKTIRDFATNETDIARQLATDKKVMDTGEPYQDEVRFVMPTTKKEVIYLVKKTPLRNKNGDIIGIICISFDITQQRKLEKLKIEETIIEQKLEALELLTSSINHEIKMPLSSIQIGAHGLKKYIPRIVENYKAVQKGQSPKYWIPQRKIKKITEVFDSINENIEYAESSIDMLLGNVQHIDEFANHHQLCSAHQCIAQLIARYPFQRRDDKLIEWIPQKNHDFEFEGTEFLVVQILFNLTKNALYYIKAANKGSIKIATQLSDRNNYLHFRDTGTGISNEILPYVFDRFFSDTPCSVGLGLTFCKLVMKNLGGNITCNSVEGEFTEFVLSFPKVHK